MRAALPVLRSFQWPVSGFLLLLCLSSPETARALRPPAWQDALASADGLFRKQHWAEARTAYDAVRDHNPNWHHLDVRRAVEGAIACSLHLSLWDDALGRGAQYVARTKGGIEEAAGERFLAGLYLHVPHYGTRRGAGFLRGQYTQGIYVSSWRKDRKEAVRHYERARDLLLALKGQKAMQPRESPARITGERIGVDFDLAAALARQDEYNDWCGRWWWGAPEEEEDSQAAEEADYEEPRWGRRGGGYDRTAPPTGVPLDANGKPRFVTTPRAYSARLAPGPRIRFLLSEIQALDTSPQKDDAARALYRWAMIARSLYGPDSAAQAYSYDNASEAGKPLKPIWELNEDEALTLVGGRRAVITLPPDENPIALLRKVAKLYPNSRLLPEAHYARALYFQTRQQFPQAVGEHSSLIELYPQHPRAKAANAQIQMIRKPGVLFGTTGISLPGGQPKLQMTYRNTEGIAFQARRVDLVKYIQDRMEKHKDRWWNFYNFQSDFLQEDHWKPYSGAEVARWTETVRPKPGLRTAEFVARAPLPDPGAYLVEATAGAATTRALVVVTDIAVVRKSLPNRGLILVADARTGAPLAGRAVRLFEHWAVYNNKPEPDLYWDSRVLKTDQKGVLEYARAHADRSSSVEALVLGPGNRFAFSLFSGWYEQDPGDYPGGRDGHRFYAITDRPVYRPGATVKFRAWIRRHNGMLYQTPAPGTPVTLEFADAKSVIVQKITAKTDELGGLEGEYTLGAEPALGIYRIRIDGLEPDGHAYAGGVFRVEEYRKPEFEVTVKPARSLARLGETVRARIVAHYYFGAPVTVGTVRYKIFRESYRHAYRADGEYDWLYGAGYGLYPCFCPWFPWQRWGLQPVGALQRSGFPAYQFPWGYYGDPQEYSRGFGSDTRKALRELVAEGTTRLNAEGVAEVDIRTARARQLLPDRDHRYTVEAEVRDASRRTIEGKGSIVVTNRQFYAFLDLDRGWCRPGETAHIRVRTLTAENVPVAAKGELTVYRLQYRNAGRSMPEEQVVRQQEAATDAEGKLLFDYIVPKSGQYRVAFRTRDAWKEEVQGSVIFWVYGDDFKGREYRFARLEIVPDKRSYQVGETAHLLVNTEEEGARILFSDHVANGVLRSYRFLDIPARSQVIDIKITERHIPNFFVEATLVRNGHVTTEARELFVPPTNSLLRMTIQTDRPQYRAGETGRVRVAVTDSRGEPVRGQVTLAAFDEAVTYIQDEFGPDPRVFYHGQKRSHSPSVSASTDDTFSPTGDIEQPESGIYVVGVPEDWWGAWSPEASGTSLSFSMKKRGGGKDVFRGRELQDEAGQSRNAGELASSTASSRPVDRLDAPAAPGGAGAPFGRPSGTAGPALIDPEVRTNFEDTALWAPKLTLDAGGIAETSVTFPQSLSTWRLHGYALTAATQVGDARATATTTKNVIVRLQAPRFFVERDEAVLSANVHNYLRTAKQVRAELTIPAGLLEPLDGGYGVPSSQSARAARGGPDAQGNLRLVVEAVVPAGAEHRFDWPVRVHHAGLANITVRALTDQESDGVRMAFPVLVHGVRKTTAQSASYRPTQEGDRTLELNVPEQVDPEQTQLELTLSPGLGGVLIDALPYLIGYPYGCVEQTMSRFYPAVLVMATLRKTGTDLESIARQRRQMNPGDLQNRFGQWQSPVFDTVEMNRIVEAGLQRLYNFQRPDGGWGWWREDDSSPYQTAYVLQGLYAARAAGIAVDPGIYERGLNYLQTAIQNELRKPADEQAIGDIQTQACLAYSLSLEHRLRSKEQMAWLDRLFVERQKLNNYGRSLLALAMHNEKRAEQAATLLRNVLQFVERDDSNETAWVRTPETGWWFWWNNDIETNAWVLRALTALDPHNDLAPRLVKWLLNNRRNGYYWRSTRDTALVIAAMTDFMQASGESAPDYTLTVSVDERPMKKVHVGRENLFTFDNRLLLSGLQLTPGAHRITLSKRGTGALYYAAYLSYFTREEDVRGAGNEISVERSYFRLVPKVETVRLHDPGQAKTRPAGRDLPLEATGHTEQRAVYERVPLRSGDRVSSGDLIEVVLQITAKNTYDYLTFEDAKPAGCEPVEVRSGGRWAGGLCANVELRDTRTVFFLGLLEQGRHVLRYKLRAETPGSFHAMPTTGFAMYAPEVRAISDEMRLLIKER